MSGQRPMRRGSPRLALEPLETTAGPAGAWLRVLAPPGQIASSLSFRTPAAALRRTERHASTPGFRQADRDRLLGRASAMFAFAHVMDFLANELTGLRPGRFALTSIAVGAFDRGFLRH